MTTSGTRREARGERQEVPSSPSHSLPLSPPPLASSLAPLALSCIALAIVFWGFWQSDPALILFLRTVHRFWLAQAGDMVNHLGDGLVLVLISGALLLVGLVFKRPPWRDAGVWSLMAHGAAGIAVQSLKRLIGRPRPRFMHGEDVQLAPSLTDGFDSFPSGHATASFAVAAVLAKYFPRLAWVFYGLAGLVAVSRVVRGSHYATDAVVGAALGLIVGLAIANPLGSRWRSSSVGLIKLAPYAAAAFALVWITIHPDPGRRVAVLTLIAGVLLVLLGTAIRFCRKLGFGGNPRWLPNLQQGNGLLAVGLALSTGSMLVTIVGCLVALAWWLEARGPTAQMVPEQATEGRAHVGIGVYVSEAGLMTLLGVTLVSIQTLKGSLPLL